MISYAKWEDQDNVSKCMQNITNQSDVLEKRLREAKEEKKFVIQIVIKICEIRVRLKDFQLLM